ncbi:hypothetical protein NC653_001579 [Populus alba x Populus x berolinensis]|uniref:Uncharacterized protein n=1 Tax=Populus alba x Populus x berolinensis TaxID=444605 RepID=A0AAD6RMF9_9ROSI|nr:hypothetical protein NC653_001575 [Populus alba x Populus x berolinensis]KAJ7011192.1 hypothetical protein NC653_001579 [Populus alba x Populus x berolinensis]
MILSCLRKPFNLIIICFVQRKLLLLII